MAQSNGIILYLRQEGRGIGLYNKLDAYSLQDQGHDTFKSNNLLGFKDDLRDYRSAADMLKTLGVNKIRLLSNNPDKCRQLKNYGIDITEQKSTTSFVNVNNHYYLLSKVKHHGHKIRINKEGAFK